MNKVRTYLTHFWVQVFFLLNTFGLIAPLAWTNFIALFGTRYYFKKKHRSAILAILLILLIYIIVHLYNGVNIKSYLISCSYLFVLFSTSYIGYYYLKDKLDKLEQSFIWAGFTCVLLFLIAIMVRPTEWGSLFWQQHDFVGLGNTFTRYKGCLLYTSPSPRDRG